MFGEPFLHAWTIFSNPWVIFLISLLLILNLVYTRTIQLTTQAEASQGAAAPGCLTQILALLFQGLIIAGLVLLLSPILLGVQTYLSWQAVEPLGFIAIRAGLLSAFIIMLISFFPFLGRLLSSSPGPEIFLLSSLTFYFLLPSLLNLFLGVDARIESQFPGLAASLAYCGLAFIVNRASLLLTHLSARLFCKTSKKTEILLNQYIGPGLDTLFGIYIFIMYASYWLVRS